MSSSDVDSGGASQAPTDSNRSSSPPIDLNDSEATSSYIKLLKRKLTNLESNGRKKRPRTTATLGRGIRRLATLYDSISNAMDEAEIQVKEGHPTETNPNDQRNRVHLANTWPLILNLVPGLKTLREELSTEQLLDYLAELQRGANAARSNDLNRIRADVANWVNESYNPMPPLKTSDRQNRGLQHDTCGGLLCPVTFNWDDLDVRAKIRASKEGFEINTNYYLKCLYGNVSEFNPRRIEQGFLRSKLLVQTYSSIFTSPSSANGIGCAEDGSTIRESTSKSSHATKSSVASILGMDGKVTGCSIAYAATLLVFNLTEASQWTTTHNNFSFELFYQFLVDYFEEKRGSTADARVRSLLEWWNSQIFPRHIATSKDENQSRDILLDQDDY